MVKMISETPDAFILYATLSFMLRIASGIGCAAANVATFTLIVRTFSDSVSTAYGFVEMSAGAGYMIGPAMGGALYTVSLALFYI